MNAVAELAWSSVDDRHAAVAGAPPAVELESPSKSARISSLRRSRSLSMTPQGPATGGGLGEDDEETLRGEVGRRTAQRLDGSGGGCTLRVVLYARNLSARK